MSEHRRTAPQDIRCLILTISDTRTVESDASGRAIAELLEAAGHIVAGRQIVRDEPAEVSTAIDAHTGTVDLIVTTGGTGITSRDSTYEAIEGLLENLRQVSSDVAHDLRTPLARLRTRLEEGALKAASGESTAAVIEESIGNVDEVLSLFAAILRIAEVEAGQTRRYFKTVDLSELLTDLADSYAPAIEDGGRTLRSSMESAVAVEGDRELLAQAVINLVENAQRHTPPGSSIRLTLTSSATTAFVQVTDDGPGVPPRELGSIPKRFSRLETSRSTPGYGLGLNLVRAVAKLHDGRLVLKNADPGLSAVIELPKAEQLADSEEDGFPERSGKEGKAARA